MARKPVLKTFISIFSFTSLPALLLISCPSLQASELATEGAVQVGYFSESESGARGTFYRGSGQVEIPLLRTELFYIGYEEKLGVFDLGTDFEIRPGSLNRVEGPSFRLYRSESDLRLISGSEIELRFDLGTVALDFEDAQNVGSFRFGARMSGFKAYGSIGKGVQISEDQVKERELCGAISVLSSTLGDNQILGMQGDLTRHPVDISLCGKVRVGAVGLNVEAAAGLSTIIPEREFELLGRESAEQGRSEVGVLRLETGVDIYLPHRRSSDRERKVEIGYAVEGRRSERNDSFTQSRIDEHGRYLGEDYVPGAHSFKSTTTHTVSVGAAF